MGSLLHSIVTFAVTLVTVLTVMAMLGIPLGPLLASAGVVGVALGFGAQSLVKDFLSGIFMILEDQYGVGDVVDPGEAIGTVEDGRPAGHPAARRRRHRLVRPQRRDPPGRQPEPGLVAPPSSTSRWPTPRTSSGSSRVIARASCEPWTTTPAGRSTIIEEPQVVGVESIAGTAVTIRIIAKCAPERAFGVQRELRERSRRPSTEAASGPPMPLRRRTAAGAASAVSRRGR